MGYKDRKILDDYDGRSIPQYFNKNKDQYEPVEGADGAYSVQLPPTTDFRTGAVTVGNTAIELKAGASTMAGRRQLIIYPPSAGRIYWGTATVTAANGAPLNAGDPPLVFDFSPDVAVKVYAVNDGTNREVRVVESK